MGARLPSEDALRLREVVILLVLVAGDEERVEAAVPGRDRLQRCEIRVGEVFLVGHEQWLAGRRDARALALVQVLLAVARPGDPQRDQVHVPPAREILADQLAEPLAEAEW